MRLCLFTRVPLEAISNVYKLYKKYRIKIKKIGVVITGGIRKLS